MNLNKIRLLEIYHKYLVSMFEKDNKLRKLLSTNRLVYRSNDYLLKFDTYETKEYDFRLGEIALGHYELKNNSQYVNPQDLFDAKNISGEEFRTFRNLTEIAENKRQIFKLLLKVDLNSLEEKYSELKTNTLVYNLYDVTLNKSFDIYKLSDNATFELVSID